MHETFVIQKPALVVPSLPAMICFRVTRFCNARCGFCLAPPDGGIHPDVNLLKNRISWLFQHGVKTIHFCGGEPTIHKDLAELLNHVTSLSGKSKMTTNGIEMKERLVQALLANDTDVKVSLHGAADLHNSLVGKAVFDKTTSTIKNLVTNKVKLSIQTTVISGHLDVVNWIVAFCLQHSIKQVSFLPFIPRGSGHTRREEYGLTQVEKVQLNQLIKQLRKEYNTRLTIRLLDFNARPIHVVEPDGSIILEGAMEAMDQVLWTID